MIYLQPQFRTNSGEILNIVSTEGQMMGYLLYLYREEKDLYVLGHLDDLGEKQNYTDILVKFISGLKDACGAKEDPYIHITCGGDKLKLPEENQ